MRIAVASDHAGYRFKEVIKRHLIEEGHEVQDFGTDSEESVDYPRFIRPAAESVANGESDRAIVLGGIRTVLIVARSAIATTWRS